MLNETPELVSEDMQTKVNQYIKPESILTIYLNNGTEIKTPCALSAEGFLTIWNKHIKEVKVPVNSHSYIMIKKRCVSSFIVRTLKDVNGDSYPFEEFQ